LPAPQALRFPAGSHFKSRARAYNDHYPRYESELHGNWKDPSRN
jgi:hypothetical protein